MVQWPEHRLLQQANSDRCSRRTGLHLIVYIDEGLFVPQRIGVSETGKRAFALHPLFQADESSVSSSTTTCSAANSYLSEHPKRPIRMSPLRDVNDKLFARTSSCSTSSTTSE